MKVSIDWLREYCDLELSPEELAGTLPWLGLQVEGIERIGGDTVLELEVTANRPDLLSMIGVAREVAAATETGLLVPQFTLEEAGDKVDGLTSVAIEAPDLCLRYVARLVTGVQVAPSPPAVGARLETVGLRPVNNIVDMTNLVLMECGQPLHAFDFDKLRGRRIVVRRARPEERITVIDGGIHTLTGEMLVIADAEAPAAVAGIMGGLDTEISESTSTILIESAHFLPASIRRTSRAMGLSSDSSYRFERGVDPGGLIWAADRAAAMMADLAGGTVAKGLIDVGRPPEPERTVSLRPARTRVVLGVDIPADRQKALLGAIGFEAVAERTDTVDFRVPSFRPDVTREIDLIEEVARTHGYDKIPFETRMRVRAVPSQKVDLVSRRVRELCAGLGYSEVSTPGFVALDRAARFAHWFPEPGVLRNPVSREEPALRTSLVPLLLRTKRTHLNRGTPDSALFELSEVYGKASDRPGERTCLALLDDDGFASLRGALDALFDALGLAGKVAYAEHADANFAAGRSTRLTLGEEPLGLAGEVTPELAGLFDLKSAPAVSELDFDLIVREATLEHRHRPLPRFPAVRRDLCVIADAGVRWADVRSRARDAAGELAESVAFLSEYRDDQIGPARKALAFAITYRADDRTLTGEEADAATARVVEALRQQLGADLRT